MKKKYEEEAITTNTVKRCPQSKNTDQSGQRDTTTTNAFRC